MTEKRHLMTVQEAADTLRISKRTYERWASRETPIVPVPITIGNDEKRVVVEELEAWLEEKIETGNRRADRARTRGEGMPKSPEIDSPPPAA